MSDTIAAENYKKSLEKIVDHWGKELEKVGKALAAVDADLAKAENASPQGPPEKKKIEELKKKRDKLRADAVAVANSLEVNLRLIEPPPKADPKQLAALPKWLTDIVKKKGVAIGKGATLAPTVDFDFKSGKLKKLGVKITW